MEGLGVVEGWGVVEGRGAVEGKKVHADRSSGVILLASTNPAMWGEYQL